jgi:acyl-CoA thioester hydrolase
MNSAKPPSSPAPSLSANWPDLSGRLADSAHVLPIRVYFEDTDFTGIVYHGAYLRWCERGRSDYLRLLGITHRELAEGEAQAAFVVRRLTLDFLKSARIDDVLTVVSRPQEVTKATITLSQRVERDGVILCSALVLLALISPAGRPLRLPPEISERFRPVP